jgi:hypothetical protein
MLIITLLSVWYKIIEHGDRNRVWYIAVDTAVANRYAMKGVNCSVSYDVP